MITLCVKPQGLNHRHDPDNPKLTDIAGSNRFAQIADRVVLETTRGKFTLKGDKHFENRLIKPDEIVVYWDDDSLTWEGEVTNERDEHYLDGMKAIADDIQGSRAWKKNQDRYDLCIHCRTALRVAVAWGYA